MRCPPIPSSLALVDDSAVVKLVQHYASGAPDDSFQAIFPDYDTSGVDGIPIGGTTHELSGGGAVDVSIIGYKLPLVLSWIKTTRDLGGAPDITEVEEEVLDATNSFSKHFDSDPVPPSGTYSFRDEFRVHRHL